jgi:hypothetical protein
MRRKSLTPELFRALLQYMKAAQRAEQLPKGKKWSGRKIKGRVEGEP